MGPPVRIISIHAPREGSDPKSVKVGVSAKDFYPRSPRGERLRRGCARTRSPEFLSTLPARGATLGHVSASLPGVGFLSTLPARGATAISLPFQTLESHFYPRSPRGERPVRFLLLFARHNISIHAPREGSDQGAQPAPRSRRYFYPRSPRGERRDARRRWHVYDAFLSTLPARGATRPVRG